MSVVLNGNTYAVSDFVGSDGYGYSEKFSATGLTTFPESIFTDMLAELASAVTIEGLSPGAAGGIIVSNGSAWIRAASATITSAGVAEFAELHLTGGHLSTEGSENLLICHSSGNGGGDMVYYGGGSANIWRVNTGGLMLLNDSANANMTIGLTINQGANDDEALALKSSDVAHGMTTNVETDTYGVLKKASSTAGGVFLVGAKDADDTAGDALGLLGYLGEAADTTKTTAALGVITLNAFVKTGTTVTTVGADGNLVVIANGASTARFIFDAEGSGHADIEFTTFDRFNGLQLLEDIETALAPGQVERRFGEFVKYDRNFLEREGLFHDIREVENGKTRGMMNWTKMLMLHTGTIIQVGGRQMALEGCLRGLIEANPTFEGRTEALALLEAA